MFINDVRGGVVVPSSFSSSRPKDKETKKKSSSSYVLLQAALLINVRVDNFWSNFRWKSLTKIDRSNLFALYKVVNCIW